MKAVARNFQNSERARSNRPNLSLSFSVRSLVRALSVDHGISQGQVHCSHPFYIIVETVNEKANNQRPAKG